MVNNLIKRAVKGVGVRKAALTTITEALGFAMIAFGIGLIYLPAGIIGAGVLLWFLAQGDDDT